MSKMKSVALALAVSSFALISGSASAANAETSTSAVNFLTPTYGTFGKTIGATFSSFIDDFTFSIPGPTNADGTGTVTPNARLSGMLLVPTVSITAFDVYSGTPGGGTHISAIDIIGAGTNPSYSFGTNLAAGNYYLQVEGTVANTSRGGSYSGSLELAPVPEPGEWILMISGLGLIGYVVRRRSGSPG